MHVLKYIYYSSDTCCHCLMSTKDKNKSKTHFKQPRIDEVKSFLNSSSIIKFIVDDIVDTRVHIVPIL